MAQARIPLLRDPLLVVTVFVLIAFLLPAQLIVEPLGAVGAPATIVAVGAAVLYALGRLIPGALADGPQPMRTMLVVFACTALISYAVGLARVLSVPEASASDRSLIGYAGFIGLGLLVADGVRNRDHLDRLLKLVVVGASALAVFGIVQFIFEVNPEDYLSIPWLTMQEGEVNVERSIFFRVKGTALHPIEFGVVLAVVLPLALHYAMTARDGSRPSRWRWLPVLLILVATPMSVSRSSALGVAIAGAITLVAWPWRLRVRAMVAGGVLLVAMRAAFPGLLGTLRSMFLFAEQDPSIEGRTNDYPVVFEYVRENPWLGRGLGTFTPEQYFYLDNEYLNRLLTGGILALLVLVALFLVAMGLGRGVYHHAADPSARALGQALTAATAVSAFAWFTYDGLGFRLNAGIAFILMGAAGALWRLEVGRFNWGEAVDRSRPIVLEPRSGGGPRGARPGARTGAATVSPPRGDTEEQTGRTERSRAVPVGSRSPGLDRRHLTPAGRGAGDVA